MIKRFHILPLVGRGALVLAGAVILAGWARADVLEAEDAADPALRGYLSGNGLLNRGLYDLAAEEYGRFLAEHEDHPKADVARYGLAVCRFRTGRYQQAVSELRQLQELEGFPYAAEVATMLGQCYLELNQYEAAGEAFEHVGRRHKGHDLEDDAIMGRVEAWYWLGRHDEAATLAQRLTDKWPQSPLRERANYFAGLALAAKGEYAAATPILAELLERDPEGPFAEHASLLLAQCHHRTGALERAVAQYQQLLRKDKGQFAPDAMLGLATVLQQQGHPQRAGEILDELLERHGDTPLVAMARLQRGRAWFDAGEMNRALEVFESVAAAGGQYADEAAYWAAKCTLRQGKPAEAAGQLAEALEHFHDSPLRAEMHYDRAVGLVKAEEYGAALDELQRFRREYPEHEMAAETLHLMAVCEHRLRRHDRSLEHCRTFAEQHPGHTLMPSVAFLSAENQFLEGQYERAATEYQEYVVKYPDGPEADNARYRRGMALYRLERFEEAEKALRAVAEDARAEERFRAALLSLGDIVFRRGEWKQAEGYLRHYLEDGPEVEGADEAMLKLGLSQQRQGRYAEAVETFALLVGEFPRSSQRLQAIFERGQALVALGRPQEARGA
ncbi:MAG: tetratricopeptide repeat protein, partial [Phycisphaerales bacterium]